MSGKPWKLVAYTLGITVTGVSVLYVLFQIYDQRIWEVDPDLLARLGAVILVGVVVYSVASLLLALAWHEELAWVGEPPLSRALSLGIYGRAQLTKYAGGGLVGLLGRQVLGRQAGFSHKALAWASLMEVFGMLYASGLLACIGASQWASAALGIPQAGMFALVGVIAILPVMLASALGRYEFTRRFTPPAMRRTNYLRLNVLFLIYVPFFVLSGLMFAMLIRAAQPGLEINWLEIVGTVSAIWLIGYITPGSSAGIGVRDALLMLALGGMLDAKMATLLVVAYRVLTVLGDLGFFGLALFVRLPGDGQRTQPR